MEKKRSMKYLLVSVCLALLVASIGGILAGANQTVTKNGDLKIAGASLDLGDDLGIAFAVEAEIAEGAQIELYTTNPGNKAASASETVLATPDKTVVNGDKTYQLFITDGFAADDLHTYVYARLVKNNEYSEVLRTSVLELVYLMKDQATDEVAIGLYDSIIAYEAAARKKINDGDATEYVFAKIEDGAFVGDDGIPATYGVFAKGSKVGAVVSASAAENLAMSNLDGYSYGVAGWSADASANLAKGCSANEITIGGAYTYTPIVSREFNTKYASSVYGATMTKDKDGKDVLGTIADIKWNDLQAGVQYYGQNSKTTNKVTTQGGFTYDAEKDMIVYSGKGKTQNATSYVAMYVDNPHRNDTIARSTVLDFNIIVPSSDYNGDGIYNEVKTDIHNLGVSNNGGTGMFNIMVAYETSSSNRYANYGSERLFNLEIYTNTGIIDDNRQAAGWALGSNANNTSKTNADGSTTYYINYTTFNGNSFNGTGGIFYDVANYKFDTEYNIKLVFTPTLVTCTNSDGSTTQVYGMDRVDIYVDDVYHHSRVIGNTKTTTNTTAYEDMPLGFFTDFEGSNYAKHSTNDHFAKRHFGALGYTLSIGSSDNIVASVAVGGLKAYATDASAEFDGQYIDTVSSKNTKECKDYTANGTPMTAVTKFSYADYLENYLYDGKIFVSSYDNGALVENAWSSLTSDSTGKGVETSKGTATAKTSWVYDEETGALRVNTANGATSADTMQVYSANPLAGKKDSYTGEVIVFEFKLRLPKGQDTNGNGKADEFSDYMYHNGKDYNGQKSSMWTYLAFGFNTSPHGAFGGYNNTDVLQSFRMDYTSQHSSSANAGDAFGGVTLKNYNYVTVNDTTKGDTSYSQNMVLGEWTYVKMVIYPTVSGGVSKVVTTMTTGNATRTDTREFSSAPTAVSSKYLNQKFAKNIFDQTIIGFTYNTRGTRIGAIEFKDVYCYAIHLN